MARSRSFLSALLYGACFTLALTYATFFRLFENFSVGWYPELLVVVSAVLMGIGLRLKVALGVIITSTVASFGLLQLIGYVAFKALGPYQLLLSVLARGGALYGVLNMALAVAVSTTAHLLLGDRND